MTAETPSASGLPLPPHRESFSLHLPTLQLAWDSTSLGEAKLCLRRYYYSIVLGLRGRGDNVHLTFGIAYHSAIERYHHWRFDGQDHEEALRNVVRFALAITWDKATKRPWIGNNKKNRLSLVRTLIWYLDQFQNDAMKTIALSSGEPACELSFRFEIDMNAKQTGEPMMFCGHLDRVAQLGDEVWVNDYKTTTSSLDERYFANYSPDNQLSLYSIGARVAYSIPVRGIIIDAAEIGVTYSRFQRGIIARDDETLKEWFRDASFYIASAHRSAEIGYWPMNDKSCGFMGGCPYRAVCSKPPRGRDEWLSAAYIRQPWDPLRIRGDI